jgi:hypothetical protein
MDPKLGRQFRIRILPKQFVAIEKKVVKKVVNAHSFSKHSIFLGLLDPDPLVRGTDPAPNPSIIKQN